MHVTKKWIARVVQEFELDISVETDGERPTEDDIIDAMAWVDNHLDSYVSSMKFVVVESYDADENGEFESYEFTDGVAEDG